MRLAAIVLPTLLSFSLSLQAYTPAKVNFYSGTFHELRKEAFEEDKPYVLYFSFTGKESSREMEGFTFQEPNLSRYISQNYLIYKVSAGSGNRGNDYLEKEFEVYEPSLIIFDAKSYELKRIRGFVDPDFLLNSLRKYQPERGNYVDNAYQDNPREVSSQVSTETDDIAFESPNSPIIEDLGPNTSVRRVANEFFIPEETYPEVGNEQGSSSQNQTSDELIIIDQADTDARETPYKETRNPVWKRKSPFQEAHRQIEDRDIINKKFDFEEESTSVDYSRPYTSIPVPAEKYEEKITLKVQEKDWREVQENEANQKPSHAVHNPHQKRGFGIQTGVFEESYFMQREIDFLQSKFQQDVLVKKAMLNGKEVYKVQVGPFASEAAARSFEKTFRRVSGNRKGMLVYIQ